VLKRLENQGLTVYSQRSPVGFAGPPIGLDAVLGEHCERDRATLLAEAREEEHPPARVLAQEPEDVRIARLDRP
jgi:hypothetical protein